MRTNIVIDSDLMEAAKKATGLKTKRQIVEEGLKLLIQIKKQTDIKKWKGKLNWEGDLNEMRSMS